MITIPSTRYAPNARAHGESSRRTTTTRTVAASSRPITSGFVVRVTAAARPIAQTHHASGWTARPGEGRVR